MKLLSVATLLLLLQPTRETVSYRYPLMLNSLSGIHDDKQVEYEPPLMAEFTDC